MEVTFATFIVGAWKFIVADTMVGLYTYFLCGGAANLPWAKETATLGAHGAFLALQFDFLLG